MGGLLGDDRDGLDARGASADDSDTHAREVDALVGPVSRVICRALEAVDAGHLGQLRLRQAPRGHHVELGRDRVAFRRRDRPPAFGVVPHGLVDARLELDVLAQVEPVGDVIGVPEDLRLG